MRVQHQIGALAQKAHAAEADRVDVDDGAIAAGLGDDVVVTHHLVWVCMRDAEGIHNLLAGLLLVIENARHDRRNAVLER